ncbi:MAG: hypothetical protein HON53_10895 [Planctomycetaceae bacterium]|jgi:hypothetical protein|nr:hypothetical protein [Planctomycetaceae bacterium]MBT6155109.1 hypothetical protein [Planctomycetaceae bacterium]MBT6483375.1 hypothetical protein [Planctomycetaceae bacterium]MBT6493830.1 hypothetical protein [Planctomycetaceae bacterium]
MSMGGHLLNDLRELLRSLETAQRDFSALQDRKRTALVEGHSDDLLSIARDETTIGDRLRALLDQRGEILDAARKSGLPGADSLLGIAANLQPKDRDELEPRIQAARKQAEQIRRETWVQWIIAHRAYSHYSSLLDLIALSGKKSPTYEAKPSKETAGGAIFDASI